MSNRRLPLVLVVVYLIAYATGFLTASIVDVYTDAVEVSDTPPSNVFFDALTCNLKEGSESFVSHVDIGSGWCQLSVDPGDVGIILWTYVPTDVYLARFP